MSVKVLSTIRTVIGLAFLTVAASASADNGINVSIRNDGTEDILVTVYDMTVEPNVVVISHARLNGFTSMPLSVAPDAGGLANVSWTAVTAEPSSRKCGHAKRLGLAEGEAVNVHADSECPVGGATPGASF